MKSYNTVSLKSNHWFDKLCSSIESYAVTHVIDGPKTTDLKEYFADVASRIGCFLNYDMDPTTAEVKGATWGSVQYDKHKCETAYRYSNKNHPLHTDYAAFPIDLGLVLMICEMPAKFGGATLFLDSRALIECLNTFDSELLKMLCSQEVEMVRSGTSSSTGKRAKIIGTDEIGPVLNWNFHRVAPTNTELVLDMCKKFHAFLEEKIVLGGIAKPIKLTAGEAFFFHDCRVLHGRHSFIGERKLMKAALALKEADTVSQKLHSFEHAERQNG